jgi:hypothetical protein
LADLFLFFFRKVYDFLACRRAAIFRFRFARLALNKQEMTTFKGTIGVLIARRSALVALADDVF